MTPTNISMNQQDQNSIEQPTLEEMDVLCRKCNHLHDEAIVRTLATLWMKVRNLFSHDDVPRHHQVQ